MDRWEEYPAPLGSKLLHAHLSENGGSADQQHQAEEVGSTAERSLAMTVTRRFDQGSTVDPLPRQ